ncbi:hypothetical protein BD413DRAFT_264222 [Trametes elegans]|nr:hypothetical protein BD413DRAFT_264222 [Trametes elegans]
MSRTRTTEGRAAGSGASRHQSGCMGHSSVDPSVNGRPARTYAGWGSSAFFRVLDASALLRLCKLRNTARHASPGEAGDGSGAPVPLYLRWAMTPEHSTCTQSSPPDARALRRRQARPDRARALFPDVSSSRRGNSTCVGGLPVSEQDPSTRSGVDDSRSPMDSASDGRRTAPSRTTAQSPARVWLLASRGTAVGQSTAGGEEKPAGGSSCVRPYGQGRPSCAGSSWPGTTLGSLSNVRHTRPVFYPGSCRWRPSYSGFARILLPWTFGRPHCECRCGPR